MQTALPLCNVLNTASKGVGKIRVKLKFRKVKGNLEN